MTTEKIDRTPWTVDRMQASCEKVTVDGVQWPIIWLGEDGDYALTIGHAAAGDADRWDAAFRRAIAKSDEGMGTEPDDYLGDDIESLWVVVTDHRPHCDEAEIEGDTAGECDCGEEIASWWTWNDEAGHAFKAAAPGAVAVTRWAQP